MGVLDKVALNPSQSVTFQPDGTKQQVSLELNNGSDKPVMFKMKSTRPGLFKMRPVYDVIATGQKKAVHLIYKGLKPGQKPGAKDHFTIVMALAPSSSTKADKMWKGHKHQAKMVAEGGETRKQHLAVVYAGILQPAAQKVDMDEDGQSNKKQGIRKGKGLVDEDKPQPPPVVMAPAVPGGKSMLLMYRPAKPIFEDESDTDDENDDDEEEN